LPPDHPDHARVDKWLWAARFYKTRSLAAAALDGGKVELNGEKAKRGKAVRPGDQLRIRLGPYEHRITVLGIAAQRGPATVAATLFREDPASRETRERQQEQHRLAARMHGGLERGRPTKRDRRALGKLKGKED
jgi:ribosome-associated heat shock protein Hsp15